MLGSGGQPQTTPGPKATYTSIAYRDLLLPKPGERSATVGVLKWLKPGRWEKGFFLDPQRYKNPTEGGQLKLILDFAGFGHRCISAE